MAGPLRISRPRPTPSAAAFTASGQGPPPGVLDNPAVADYIHRLMRLIPAAFVTIYPPVAGMIPKDDPAVIGWPIIAVVMLVVSRAVLTSDPAHGRGPQWGAVTVAVVSFLIWLYTLDGPLVDRLFGNYYPHWGLIAVVAWTFLTPFIFGRLGQPESQPAEPSDPAKPAAPGESAGLAEADLSEQVKVKPAETAPPAEPRKPVEPPAKPAKPATPVDAAKPTAPAQSAGPAEAVPAKQVEAASQPTEATKRDEAAKRVEPAAPVGPDGPVEPAEAS